MKVLWCADLLQQNVSAYKDFLTDGQKDKQTDIGTNKWVMPLLYLS